MPPISTAIQSPENVSSESKLCQVQDIAEFKAVAQQGQPSVLVEFVDFLRNNRKWWLTPLVVLLLLFSGLILLTRTAAAPFIYILF